MGDGTQQSGNAHNGYDIKWKKRSDYQCYAWSYYFPHKLTTQMKNIKYSVSLPVVGAISGDIIGSQYEQDRIWTKDFPILEGGRFTDDSVMTIAILEAFSTDRDYKSAMQKWGWKYPNCGFGRDFKRWLNNGNPQPYQSYGNGSAMRVSAIGCIFNSAKETLREAELTALPSHNHPEGIKGAQAIALSIFRARTGASKSKIKSEITRRFKYKLERTVEVIRKKGGLDLTCQTTVPASIICFLESTDYEDAIRNAISLGGDSDTLACITGSIAAAFYKEIPEAILRQTMKQLKPNMKNAIRKFENIVNNNK